MLDEGITTVDDTGQPVFTTEKTSVQYSKVRKKQT